MEFIAKIKRRFVMKKISKLMAIILTFIISLSFFNQYTYAKEIDEYYSVTISEYDMYKNFINKSKKELLKEGYSLETIDSIKNFDFVGELFRRATLSEYELTQLGYNKDQIKIFKNFSGSESEIRLLAANLTFGIFKRGSGKSSNYSYAKVSIQWEWSQCPFFTQEDIVAVGWTDNMYCDSNTDIDVDAYWADISSNKYVNQTKLDAIVALNKGAYIKEDIVPMGSNSYLRSGIMNVTIHKNARVEEVAFLAKYGHNQLGLSPSVDISVDGISIGISFSWYVNDEAIKDLYYEL